MAMAKGLFLSASPCTCRWCVSLQSRLRVGAFAPEMYKLGQSLAKCGPGLNAAVRSDAYVTIRGAQKFNTENNIIFIYLYIFCIFEKKPLYFNSWFLGHLVYNWKKMPREQVTRKDDMKWYAGSVVYTQDVHCVACLKVICMERHGHGMGAWIHASDKGAAGINQGSLWDEKRRRCRENFWCSSTGGASAPLTSLVSLGIIPGSHFAFSTHLHVFLDPCQSFTATIFVNFQYSFCHFLDTITFVLSPGTNQD